MAGPEAPSQQLKPAQSLAERFWSIARGMESSDPVDTDPDHVVRHVLKILDNLAHGQTGAGLTANTLDFVVLLRQHELMGDLTYASPEQARGETVDQRSVVFSVGVLLFEKLTGRHPFGTEANARRLARMQKGEMGSGVAFFPKIPDGLRRILMRAMGPFPEDRFESIADLRTALERFVGDTIPEPARIDEDPTKVVKLDAVELMARFQADQAIDTPPSLIPLPAPKPSPLRRLAPLAWIALGASLASLAFILKDRSESEPASASASPPAPDSVSAPVPAFPTVTRDPESGADADADADAGKGTGTGTDTGQIRHPPDTTAIRDAIARRVHYPRQARSRGIEGTVLVRFSIRGDGSISDPVLASSVDPSLDAAALAAVRAAAPYASPPGKVRVPVEFSLGAP